mmetsp:Transcript_4331/g.12984  ORF Transcript_4331/g.12984 Transcript_4331/m.12984 type:complete len:227 (+) Transcript_4331:339-1019(+)
MDMRCFLKLSAISLVFALTRFVRHDDHLLSRLQALSPAGPWRSKRFVMKSPWLLSAMFLKRSSPWLLGFTPTVWMGTSLTFKRRTSVNTWSKLRVSTQPPLDTMWISSQSSCPRAQWIAVRRFAPCAGSKPSIQSSACWNACSVGGIIVRDQSRGSPVAGKNRMNWKPALAPMWTCSARFNAALMYVKFKPTAPDVSTTMTGCLPPPLPRGSKGISASNKTPSTSS